MKLFFEFGQVVQELMSFLLKEFLSGPQVALLFSGVYPFMQFLKRACHYGEHSCESILYQWFR